MSRNEVDLLSRAAGQLRNKIVHEQRDVLASLPKWWDFNWKHIEAVKQILAESTILDHVFKIAVSGGNHPHTNLDCPRAAETFELLLLYCTQQFRLHFQTDVADLVQKKRASVGKFESPFSLDERTGKGPLFVPEDFALGQSGRNRSAVHSHKMAIAPGAEIVNGPGNQLLSGASFTMKQYRRIGRRNDRDLLQHLLQG